MQEAQLGTLHSPPALEIKSAHFNLLALRPATIRAADFGCELATKLGSQRDFFDNDVVVLDLSALAARDERIDFGAFVAEARRHGLFVAGVRGGSSAQREAAAAAGLGVFPAAIAASARPAPAPTRAPPLARHAKLIERPVRGGQQVYAKESDLALLAAVNPGAEVMADGHIHCYAPLKGRALAGVSGESAARIFCLSLEAELVAIAGIYRVLDQSEPRWGEPAQIYLEGERLAIAPLG
jgi:septum site-determining protein MinC